MNTLLRLGTLPLAVICCTGIVLNTMSAAQAAAAAKEEWYLSRPDGSKTYGFTSLEQCRASKNNTSGSCNRASSGSSAHASAQGGVHEPHN